MTSEQGTKCWGELSDSALLAAPVRAELASSTMLLRAGALLCGRSEASVPWSCGELDASGTTRRARSWVAQLGPDLIDIDTVGHDIFVALMRDGTVHIGPRKNEPVAGPTAEALVAVDCEYQEPGWLTLSKGQVQWGGACVGRDNPMAKSKITQIEGTTGGVVALDSKGRISMMTRNGDTTEAGTDGRFVKLAASASGICALNKSGRVWCRSMALPRVGRASGDAWIDAELEGVLDLSLHQTLCVRTAEGVQCAGVDDEPDATPVRGAPQFVEVSAGNSLCGRTQDGAVWCWGDRRQPMVVAKGAHAIEVAEHHLFWLDAEARLHVQRLTDRVVTQTTVAGDLYETLPISPYPEVAVHPGSWSAAPEGVVLYGEGTRRGLMCARIGVRATCWRVRGLDTAEPTLEPLTVPFSVAAMAPGAAIATDTDGKIWGYRRGWTDITGTLQPTLGEGEIELLDGGWNTTALFRVGSGAKMCELPRSCRHYSGLPTNGDWVSQRSDTFLSAEGVLKVPGGRKIPDVVSFDQEDLRTIFLTESGETYVMGSVLFGAAGTYGALQHWTELQ